MDSMPDFEQLYRTYYPSVYKICLAHFGRADFAKEVTQEAFSRAFINLEGLRDKERFLPWVVAIAMHYGYKRARLDKSRFNELPPEDQLEQGLGAVDHEDIPLEELNFIRSWILTLSEPDQQLFLLRYYYHRTYAEISRETGKPLGTVKSRLSTLRVKLMEAMPAE